MIFSKLVYLNTSNLRHKVILRILLEKVLSLNSRSKVFWAANFLSEGCSLDYGLSYFVKGTVSGFRFIASCRQTFISSPMASIYVIGYSNGVPYMMLNYPCVMEVAS